MKSNLKLAYELLLSSQKRDLFLLLLLMMVVALLESAGIGMLLPYIGIVNSPSILLENAYLGFIYKWSGFQSTQAFIVFSSIILILLFVFKNAIFTLQSYAQSKILLEIQLSLESRLMGQYFRKNYIFFTQKNSSELVQNIRNVSGIVGLIFMPTLTAMTELAVLACILMLLILVQPWLTLIVGGFSIILLWIIFQFTRRKASKYGEEATESLVSMAKWMYQGFGGIKEVKILSKEIFFLEQSILYSKKAAWSGMKATMLTTLTRPVIETVWFSVTIILILVAITLGESGATLLPIIALLAASAMRIMPALNRILNAAIAIRQATYHVQAVSAEIRPNIGEDVAFERRSDVSPFISEIKFRAVSFEYPNAGRSALKNLTFTIKKGQSIAFVGPSGAGKSTAVDLLLGLLTPKSGDILVDGIPLRDEDASCWHLNFGYVPQSIYLSDDSVKNNIAFGELDADIDQARMEVVIAQAQLSEVLNRLPQGLATIVGDRGARLSGGQRQRIGIARALYRDPPILVLDEATSALDNETEREITRAIRDLKGGKTVILIAHRLSTVAHCDQIVFLVDGAVRACGTYDALMRDCDEFRRFATAGAELVDADLSAK